MEKVEESKDNVLLRSVMILICHNNDNEYEILCFKTGCLG